MTKETYGQNPLEESPNVKESAKIKSELEENSSRLKKLNKYTKINNIASITLAGVISTISIGNILYSLNHIPKPPVEYNIAKTHYDSLFQIKQFYENLPQEAKNYSFSKKLENNLGDLESKISESKQAKSYVEYESLVAKDSKRLTYSFAGMAAATGILILAAFNTLALAYRRHKQEDKRHKLFDKYAEVTGKELEDELNKSNN